MLHFLHLKNWYHKILCGLCFCISYRPHPQPLPLKGGECLRSPLRRTRRQQLPSLVGEGLGVGSVTTHTKSCRTNKSKRRGRKPIKSSKIPPKTKSGGKKHDVSSKSAGIPLLCICSCKKSWFKAIVAGKIGYFGRK